MRHLSVSFRLVCPSPEKLFLQSHRLSVRVLLAELGRVGRAIFLFRFGSDRIGSLRIGSRQLLHVQMTWCAVRDWRSDGQLEAFAAQRRGNGRDAPERPMLAGLEPDFE